MGYFTTPPDTVELVPHVYSHRENNGFDVLIKDPSYNDVLFIFNDNEEAYRAFERNEPAGFVKGGGNAVIRPYREPDATGRIRAAGIPTGRKGAGYQTLDERAKKAIQDAGTSIFNLLSDARVARKPYKRVLYSADPRDPTKMGFGIFEVSDDAGAFIMQVLKDAVESYNANA